MYCVYKVYNIKNIWIFNLIYNDIKLIEMTKG
jgi:hypothetical protein